MKFEPIKSKFRSVRMRTRQLESAAGVAEIQLETNANECLQTRRVRFVVNIIIDFVMAYGRVREPITKIKPENLILRSLYNFSRKFSPTKISRYKV